MEIEEHIAKQRARRRSNSPSHIQEKWTLGNLHSEKEFSAIVEREQERANRHNSLFSLVAFSVGDTDRDRSITYRLVKVLNKRLRLIDEVGWLETGLLGVLLPGTQAKDAQRFAEDISRKISNRKLHSFFKSYTYPSERLPGSKENVSDNSPTNIEHNRGVAQGTQLDKDNILACVSLGEGLDPFLGQGMPAWKRGMDIFGSLFGLFLLFPLFIFLSIFIKVMSPGPVFFRQKRIGYMGKAFDCWKFRTMHANSYPSSHEQHVIDLMKSDNAYSKLDDYDPRIIPFGKLLRKTGLDELPQLFNVLQGEMSLVGPRPELPYSFLYYDLWQKRRFHVLPGLTGLWQVNGKNRTTFKQMIHWDITYIERRSFWLDLTILLKTPAAIAGQVFNFRLKKLGREHPQ